VNALAVSMKNMDYQYVFYTKANRSLIYCTVFAFLDVNIPHGCYFDVGIWHNLGVNIQNISPLVIKFLLLWMSLIVLHWTGLVTFSSLIGVNIVA